MVINYNFKGIINLLLFITPHIYCLFLLVESFCEQNNNKMMNRTTKNIVQSTKTMFETGFIERHDLEQYFWSEDTVNRLLYSLSYIDACCCLTTPSLGHGFYAIGREEVVLDIDRRFEYLPKFRYFDILLPTTQDESFNILILDPPFFYIPMEKIYEAVLTITKGDTNTKLLIGFLKREEETLLRVFHKFNLKRTEFPLEYSTVKPNKWKNYVLYSNVDLPGIKRK